MWVLRPAGALCDSCQGPLRFVNGGEYLSLEHQCRISDVPAQRCSRCGSIAFDVTLLILIDEKVKALVQIGVVPRHTDLSFYQLGIALPLPSYPRAS